MHQNENIALKKIREKENERKRKITCFISSGFAFLSFLAFLNAFFNKIMEKSTYQGVSPVVVFLVFIFFVAIYFLSRYKSHTAAAIILISLIFAGAFYTSYKWGVSVPQSYLLFALIFIMSWVLVSAKFSIFAILSVVASVITLTIMQTKGILPFDKTWTAKPSTLWDSIFRLGTLGVIAAISWLYNQEITKSLKRAWQSEADLQKERDMLEIKVEERTEELKNTQMEKAVQLYRFAEFGRIASGLFHDLVNPLTAVSLNLESLKKDELKKKIDKEICLERISDGMSKQNRNVIVRAI
ncbi:hypothetical protein C4572_03200 [Candidatus Parcubacteria bacterium]|nr:MAG: hypothetical protein C4572_03200 [Candidatus Parcubacteria bacterium]